MPTLPLGASLRVFWHALGCALVPAICVCTASVGGHCADGRARSAAALSSGSLWGNQQQRPSDREAVASLDGVRAVACPTTAAIDRAADRTLSQLRELSQSGGSPPTSPAVAASTHPAMLPNRTPRPTSPGA